MWLKFYIDSQIMGWKTPLVRVGGWVGEGGERPYIIKCKMTCRLDPNSGVVLFWDLDAAVTQGNWILFIFRKKYKKPIQSLLVEIKLYLFDHLNLNIC